jgi:hypothetical protein
LKPRSLNSRPAFTELDNLQGQKEELEHAFVQAAEDEKQILADSTSTEAQSVKRLLEARARKDIRAERLNAHKKRIANHRDLVTFDIGEPLRKAFARFAHSLLMAKEAEMSALFYSLLPSGSIPGADNRTLVQACAPVTRIRQIANWCNNQPLKDQEQELAQLMDLPRRWLAALRGLVQEETNGQTRHP